MWANNNSIDSRSHKSLQSIKRHIHRMLLSKLASIYDQLVNELSSINDNASKVSRAACIKLRHSIIANNNSIIKVAFDTRRINQETEYNPRRGLQYYHRNEGFITKDGAEQIKTFFKLKTAVDTIKDDFIGDPDWFDSYVRILSATLDRTLRIDQKDMDFFKPQLDYLQELLYLRYRLKNDDIQRLGEKEIRDVILNKDEKLLYKQIYSHYDNKEIKKQTSSIMPQNQIIKERDNLVENLLGQVRANVDNKSVERSVTITVKDQINDNINKQGA
jgi:hypothetical protein